ncbi:MAG: hypothetical protein AMJ65_15045, partial [Phycisphaerae bacterium SG8_4]
GGPHTAHTIGDVPLVIFDERLKGCKLRAEGKLADIGPTLLEMMGLPQPEEMTGHSLLEKSPIEQESKSESEHLQRHSSKRSLG